MNPERPTGREWARTRGDTTWQFNTAEQLHDLDPQYNDPDAHYGIHRHPDPTQEPTPMTTTQHYTDALVVYALAATVLTYAIPATDWIVIVFMAIVTIAQTVTLYYRLQTDRYISRMTAHTRDVRSLPIRGADGTTRGWVRLDADRVGHANQTEFCITINTTSYLSPAEAQAFAAALLTTAALAERMLQDGAAK